MYSFVFKPEIPQYPWAPLWSSFSEHLLPSYYPAPQIPTASSPFSPNCGGSAGVSSRKMVLGRKPGPGPGLSSQHVFFSPGWQSCAASRPVFENTCFVPIFSSVLILWQENTYGLSYHPIMARNRGLLKILLCLNHSSLKHWLHWLYIGC